MVKSKRAHTDPATGMILRDKKGKPIISDSRRDPGTVEGFKENQIGRAGKFIAGKAADGAARLIFGPKKH